MSSLYSAVLGVLKSSLLELIACFSSNCFNFWIDTWMIICWWLFVCVTDKDCEDTEGVMRERVWADVLPYRPLIAAATGSGTHRRHKDILVKHRFYIAVGLTLPGHHPGNIGASHTSNIYSLVRHTNTSRHSHVHINNTCTQVRVMSLLTSLFLFHFLTLSWCHFWSPLHDALRSLQWTTAKSRFGTCRSTESGRCILVLFSPSDSAFRCQSITCRFLRLQ